MTIWEQSQLALWILVAIQSLLLLVVLRQMKTNTIHGKGIPPGMMLPNLDIATLRGEFNRLHNVIEGHSNTMFCIVQYGCKFCMEIIPELDRIAQSYPNFNLKLLIVGDAESAQMLLAKTETKLPYHLISQSDLKKKLAISQLPFGFLIEESGVIMRREPVKKENLLSWLIDVPQYANSISMRKEAKA